MSEELFPYYFSTGELRRLREKSGQSKKRVRGVVGVPTMVTLPAVSVVFRTGVSRVEPTSIWLVHDEYRDQNDGPSEARTKKSVAGADLWAVPNEDLLQSKAQGTLSPGEETLMLTQSLISAVGYEVSTNTKDMWSFCNLSLQQKVTKA